MFFRCTVKPGEYDFSFSCLVKELVFWIEKGAFMQNDWD